MKDKDSYIHFGTAFRPHGIRGAFSVKLFNPENSCLKKGLKLRLFPSSPASKITASGEDHIVEKITIGPKSILALEGVNDRNRCEEMIPFDFYVRRDELPKLEPGEFYIEDLVGMSVLDENSRPIGEVISHFDNGAQLVLVLRLEDGELELPFVETFFPKLDFELGQIVLRRPEFL